MPYDFTNNSTNEYNINDSQYMGMVNDGNSQVKGDIALWKAVITQSLSDAGSNSKKPEMKKAKAEAIAWLAGLSEDFEMVCFYANMCPDYVRRKSKEAIARGCVWREVNPNSFTKNRKQKKIKQIDVIKFDKKGNITTQPQLSMIRNSGNDNVTKICVGQK